MNGVMTGLHHHQDGVVPVLASQERAVHLDQEVGTVLVSQERVVHLEVGAAPALLGGVVLENRARAVQEAGAALEVHGALASLERAGDLTGAVLERVAKPRFQREDGE